jgi:hypothetical protein
MIDTAPWLVKRSLAADGDYTLTGDQAPFGRVYETGEVHTEATQVPYSAFPTRAIHHAAVANSYRESPSEDEIKYSHGGWLHVAQLFIASTSATLSGRPSLSGRLHRDGYRVSSCCGLCAMGTCCDEWLH